MREEGSGEGQGAGQKGPARAIVEADSPDETVRIFAGHPHLRLSKGNWIEVLECPPMPGQGRQ